MVIILNISNLQDVIISVLIDLVYKFYFADYTEFDYGITYCP